ncbi:MAG: patatin-like phospholipase family protein, partial [Tepidisphaeraceae bacterium]
RNPQKDWVKPRGLIRFLSGGQSYADIPGLEREMHQALDMEKLQRIADAGTTGRMLAVNTTNLDTAEMCVWDIVAESQRAVRDGNADRVQQILLASASIPGAFPPRLIDGFLYVDGGVTGNILYIGQRGDVGNDGFLARWIAAYPNTPLPTVRYWVIFNNEFRWPPEIVQPEWFDVLGKSSTTSTRATTLNSMRQLFLQAELARLKHQANVEVRLVAVPDGWVAPEPGVFKKQTMNALADLGEKMGADPASWRTTPP